MRENAFPLHPVVYRIMVWSYLRGPGEPAASGPVRQVSAGMGRGARARRSAARPGGKTGWEIPEGIPVSSVRRQLFPAAQQRRLLLLVDLRVVGIQLFQVMDHNLRDQ